MRSRAFLVLAALWLASTSLRCNLFEPARPEPPSGAVIIPDYEFPENTLDTIEQAIEDKGAHANAQSVYKKSFADSMADGRAFHAFFDPASVIRAQPRPVPDDWDDDREGDFYGKFIAVVNAEYEMTWEADPFSPNDEIDDGGGRALLHRKYTVTAISNDEETIIAYGYADLYLVRITSDRWAIVRWDDREGPDPMPNPEAITLGQRRLELQ